MARRWTPIQQKWHEDRLVVRLLDEPETAPPSRARTAFGFTTLAGSVLAIAIIPFLGMLPILVVPVLAVGALYLLGPWMEALQGGPTQMILSRQELVVRGTGIGAPKLRVPVRAVRLAESRLSPFAGLYLEFGGDDILIPAAQHDPDEVQAIAVQILRAADSQRAFVEDQRQALREHGRAMSDLLTRGPD